MTFFNKNGEKVLIEEDLMTRLEEELATWHWTPWLRTRTQVQDGVVTVNPGTRDSVESFPDGWFTGKSITFNGILSRQ